MRILIYVAQPTFGKTHAELPIACIKNKITKHVSAFNDTDSTKGYGYGYGYGQTVKQNHGIKK
jgi:hypothetical protein